MKNKNFKYAVFMMICFVLAAFSSAAWSQQSGGSAPAAAAASAPGVSGPAAGPASGAPSGLPQMTPQQADAYQSLSPGQQQAIQQELGKTGGQITPQAIEALKGRPEFQNISPEDVAIGKQLLEQKEKGEKDDEEKRRVKNAGITEIIGGETQDDEHFTRSREVRSYQNISVKLKLFGSDFFKESAVRVVTDRKNIPVPLKYVVGPGDEVKILMWGRLNTQYNLTVDRDGKITIPQVGPLFVAGMTFEEMSKHLISESQRIVGTNIDISMGSLKSISVFILGDVRKPGAYTIGSFATITDALVMVGGSTGIGSMRRVQLRRNNKLVTTFDLYDLLLKGDKSKDVILQSGDVIFVPVTGPLVGIAGNVKRPAIYELKDKHDLQNLVSYAGGINPNAYTQQIQVERIVRGEKQIVVDINDKNMERAGDFYLQDADLVKIFSIVDANANAVYISGNIKKPGKYEYKPGMTLKDLISKPDELLPETHYDYALVKRLKPPSMEPLLIPFNLGKFLFHNDPAHNIVLEAQDQIFIFNKSFFVDKEIFQIEGEVRKGGRFALIRNFRIKDAILAAGDLTKEAYLEKGELIRVDKAREYKTIYFNVGDAMAGDARENILLQDEDRIVIHSILEEKTPKTVSIAGEVNRPGTYPFMEGMTVKNLVFAAGNTRESVYLDQAEITSMHVDEGETARISVKTFNLGKALSGDEEHNVQLKPYDRIFVRKIIDWRRETYASISGEIKFPGKYMLVKGEKLSSLIERAGGYTNQAYLRGAVFTREKVKEMQQKTIMEMADRLERELLASSAIQASTVLSAEELASKKVEDAQKKQLIDNLKKVRALGRMTIKLGHLRLLKKSGYDIELEDGDSLFIPEKSSVVGVVGAVMSQGAYVFSEKADYQDYINMSGGYGRYADQGNVFILKVDGSARKPSRGIINWNSQKDRLEMAAFSEEATNYVEPGDMIAVPENFERIAWMREIRDITQILMNTAVAAGVVIKLF